MTTVLKELDISASGGSRLKQTQTIPVDLGSPHYHVRVQEKDRTWTDITDRTLSVKHTDSGGRKPSMVDLSLDNSDDYVVDRERLMRKGSIFKVGYGYPGLWREAGEFIAKEHKGDNRTVTITVHEKKRAKASRKMETRVWGNPPVTRSQVVREVLGTHGFSASELDITETFDFYASITQPKGDDWDFCRKLADLEGFSFYADDSGVHWIKPPRGKSPTHMMQNIKGTIGIGMIQKYSFDSFGVGVPGRVKLSGRDPLTKKTFTVEGSDTATKDLDTLVITGDIPTPDEGDRQDQGVSGYEIQRNIGARSEAEAKKLADSIYKEYRYNALKVSLEVDGDPTIRTHSNTLVWGIGRTLDGIYAVKEVVHDIGKGYKGTVKLRRDGTRKGGGVNNSVDRAMKELRDSFQGLHI